MESEDESDHEDKVICCKEGCNGGGGGGGEAGVSNERFSTKSRFDANLTSTPRFCRVGQILEILTQSLGCCWQ